MATPAPAQEQYIMEIVSITTAIVGIVKVVVPTEHARLVVPGQEVPHCVWEVRYAYVVVLHNAYTDICELTI